MLDLFRIFFKWATGTGITKEHLDTIDVDPALLMEIRYKTMSEKKRVISNISLQKARFVVFDLETTGFNPCGGDEIISVGAVTVENGNIDKESFFDKLVNPHRIIPPTITELTGISNEMTNMSPSILQVLNEFLSFAKGSILVAHHANFDLSFINLKLKQFCHTRITHPIIDTAILANEMLIAEKSHTLDSLIKIYGISPAGRHTSLGDAVITAEILVKMLGQLSARGIETLQDLYSYFSWRSSRSFV